jgi:hypothetical protein
LVLGAQNQHVLKVGDVGSLRVDAWGSQDQAIMGDRTQIYGSPGIPYW